MDPSQLFEILRSSGGIPTPAALEAADKLRRSGWKPRLPLPLKEMIAQERSNSFVPTGEISDDKYEYTPLPSPSSIRLLEIHGEDEDGLLHCDLQVVDLDNEALYSCLSYTWGNPYPDTDWSRDSFESHDSTAKWPIVCGGKMLYVKQNLYDALQRVPINPVNFERERGTNTTVLHRTAASGNVNMVWGALTGGTDVNLVDARWRTPLHYAAENGHREIAEALFEEGADPGRADSEDWTPIRCAERNGHDAIAELLKSGARKPTPRRPQNMSSFIWIDALCINQDDLAERSQQVSIMSRIFKQARTVIAWLGPADGYTETACRTVSRIAQQYRRYGGSGIPPWKEVSRDTYRRAGLPYISYEDWKALAMLYLRAWFGRAWVLQEVILAQSDLLIFCGSHQIIFNELAFVTEAIVEMARRSGALPATDFRRKIRMEVRTVNGRELRVPRVALSKQYTSAVEYDFVVIMKLKMRWLLDRAGIQDQAIVIYGREASFSMASMIHLTWTMESSVPHDKIYGMLSLIKSDPGSLEVYPDYSRPAVELYAAVTKEVIRAERSLDHLSTFNDRSLVNLQDLPSWVPDYSFLGHGVMHNHRYTASGKDTKWLEHRPSPAWDMLTVQGVLVGTIDCLGQANAGMNSQFVYDATWWNMLGGVDLPETGQSRGEVLFRTLCMGLLEADEHSRAQFRQIIMGMICGEAESEDTVERVRASRPVNAIVRTSGDASERPEVQSISAHPRAPDPSVDGPCYAGIRESLDTLDVLAQAEPESSWLPTLEEVDLFRQWSEWKMWMSQRSRLINPPPDAEVFGACGERMARRRLFKTDHGLLGLGSNSLEVGDEVWVLADASMPFVLRKDAEGRRTLVAPAYVHGIMQGEAVRGREKDFQYVDLR